MLLVLPALVIPFITMAFWALDGGKTDHDKSNAAKQQGFNNELPGTGLPDYTADNKLSFYMKAEADSIKRKEELLNDPYFQDSLLAFDNSYHSIGEGNNDFLNQGYTNSYPTQMNLARSEQKIQRQIEELNRQINIADSSENHGNIADVKTGRLTKDKDFSRDVDRMAKMMNMMEHSDEPDPELLELNGTLEKILDIQHPQRVIDRTRQASFEHREQVFIALKDHAPGISLLDTSRDEHQDMQSKFLGTQHETAEANQNIIQATIQESKSVTTGSVIKIQLLDDLYINGQLIPKGHLIYGTANLNDERIQILVSSVKMANSMYPVKLKAYDLDGLPGLYIPGTISGDVSREGIDRGLSLNPLNSLNPSLEIQAASAGISTAKKLVSKKIKQVKAFVKTGYKILLQNENQEY